MPDSSTEPLNPAAITRLVTSIVDAEIANNQLAPRQKADRTWVTAIDLAIEKRLKAELLGRFPTLVHVGEEEESSHREEYDFTGDYLVIDPIDGTENFIAGTGLFGTLLSMRVGSDELHLIYLPERNTLLTNHTLDPATELRSDICVMSTRCCRQTWQETDSLRVMGSSAVMFAMLLQGQASRFVYCQGAKIWDCYTGIRLAAQLGLAIDLEGTDLATFEQRPRHRTAFELRWPSAADRGRSGD